MARVPTGGGLPAHTNIVAAAHSSRYGASAQTTPGRVVRRGGAGEQVTLAPLVGVVDGGVAVAVVCRRRAARLTAAVVEELVTRGAAHLAGRRPSAHLAWTPFPGRMVDASEGVEGRHCRSGGYAPTPRTPLPPLWLPTHRRLAGSTAALTRRHPVTTRGVAPPRCHCRGWPPTPAGPCRASGVQGAGRLAAAHEIRPHQAGWLHRQSPSWRHEPRTRAGGARSAMSGGGRHPRANGASPTWPGAHVPAPPARTAGEGRTLVPSASRPGKAVVPRRGRGGGGERLSAAASPPPPSSPRRR